MDANISVHHQSSFDFEVFCPLDGTHLNVLRRFVTSVAQEIGFPQDEISKIEIAVDEACSNVILHAYKNHNAAQGHERPGIEMRLNTEPDGILIQVQDHGCGSDERMHGVDSFNEYILPGREHYQGLGILIMKEFMDEVRFLSKPHEGTIVTLRKKIHPRAMPSNPLDKPLV